MHLSESDLELPEISINDVKERIKNLRQQNQFNRLLWYPFLSGFLTFLGIKLIY